MHCHFSAQGNRQLLQQIVPVDPGVDVLFVVVFDERLDAILQLFRHLVFFGDLVESTESGLQVFFSWINVPNYVPQTSDCVQVKRDSKNHPTDGENLLCFGDSNDVSEAHSGYNAKHSIETRNVFFYASLILDFISDHPSAGAQVVQSRCPEPETSDHMNQKDCCES